MFPSPLHAATQTASGPSGVEACFVAFALLMAEKRLPYTPGTQPRPRIRRDHPATKSRTAASHTGLPAGYASMSR